jgi:DNA-binding Lrp family transcriptional regulator
MMGSVMPLCYVLLNVKLGSEEKVLNEVRKVPNVKKSHRVYDMIAEVEGDSMDALKEIVTWKIRRLEGVRSTLTAIVIE